MNFFAVRMQFLQRDILQITCQLSSSLKLSYSVKWSQNIYLVSTNDIMRVLQHSDHNLSSTWQQRISLC